VTSSDKSTEWTKLYSPFHHLHLTAILFCFPSLLPIILTPDGARCPAVGATPIIGRLYNQLGAYTIHVKDKIASSTAQHLAGLVAYFAIVIVLIEKSCLLTNAPWSFSPTASEISSVDVGDPASPWVASHGAVTVVSPLVAVVVSVVVSVVIVEVVVSVVIAAVDVLTVVSALALIKKQHNSPPLAK
jgi:hypothetical protein